ncbi:MAG: thioredoxin [Alphaproteobacteria bacterium]
MEMIDDNSFESEVLEATGPVLVDFFAEWCGPCRQMLPLVSDLATQMAGKIKVCKMNVDDAPKTPASFDIQTIPTLMIFKDGQLVDKKVGAMTQSQLTDWVSSHL